jgi:hypothetical protein
MLIMHISSFLLPFLASPLALPPSLPLSLPMFLSYLDEVDLESVAPKIQQLLKDCSEEELADMVSYL